MLLLMMQQQVHGPHRSRSHRNVYFVLRTETHRLENKTPTAGVADRIEEKAQRANPRARPRKERLIHPSHGHLGLQFPELLFLVVFFHGFGLALYCDGSVVSSRHVNDDACIERRGWGGSLAYALRLRRRVTYARCLRRGRCLCRAFSCPCLLARAARVRFRARLRRRGRRWWWR